MIETKLTRFLRGGGNGGVLLTGAVSGIFGYDTCLTTKADIPGYAEMRAYFISNLERADLINRNIILKFAGASFSPPLTVDQLPDISADKDVAVDEWERRIFVLWDQWSERPDRFPSIRRMMESDLITSFAGLINERRQHWSRY